MGVAYMHGVKVVVEGGRAVMWRWSCGEKRRKRRGREGQTEEERRVGLGMGMGKGIRSIE